VKRLADAERFRRDYKHKHNAKGMHQQTEKLLTDYLLPALERP
jgi:hypothetical protein